MTIGTFDRNNPVTGSQAEDGQREIREIKGGVLDSFTGMRDGTPGTDDVQAATGPQVDAAIGTANTALQPGANVSLLANDANYQSGTEVDATVDADVAAHNTDPASHAAAMAIKQDTTEKGVPNGYASLNSTGEVPPSQLPLASAPDLVGYTDSVGGQKILPTGWTVVSAGGGQIVLNHNGDLTIGRQNNAVLATPAALVSFVVVDSVTATEVSFSTYDAAGVLAAAGISFWARRLA